MRDRVEWPQISLTQSSSHQNDISCFMFCAIEKFIPQYVYYSGVGNTSIEERIHYTYVITANITKAYQWHIEL